MGYKVIYEKPTVFLHTWDEYAGNQSKDAIPPGAGAQKDTACLACVWPCILVPIQQKLKKKKVTEREFEWLNTHAHKLKTATKNTTCRFVAIFFWNGHFKQTVGIWYSVITISSSRTFTSHQVKADTHVLPILWPSRHSGLSSVYKDLVVMYISWNWGHTDAIYTVPPVRCPGVSASLK